MTHKSKVEWREVLDGVYMVSSGGALRRNKPAASTFVGRLLTPFEDRCGYLQYGVMVDGKSRQRSIHSLVAHAFIGERPIGLVVNHIDHDKNNNHYSNLEYVTALENTRKATEAGVMLRGEESPSSKLTAEEVLSIRKLYPKMSQRKLARRFNISRSNVQFILRRKIWKHV